MNKNEFINTSSSFNIGEIVTVSGKDIEQVYDTLCLSKSIIEQSGKYAMVYCSDAKAGLSYDIFIGTDQWKARNKYFDGQYVIPTSYSEDYILHTKTHNCLPLINPRLRYKCVKHGTTGDNEPIWPTSIGSVIEDNIVTWKATSLDEDGIIFELISLWAQNSFVVLIAHEFDQNGPKAKTGNIINDVVLDLADPGYPLYNYYKHNYFWTRELFPYITKIYFYDTSKDEILFIKNQSPYQLSRH